MRKTALLLCCMALPAGGLAQTYKWVDERGQVHYGQVPPKRGDFEVIAPPPPPAAAPNQEALKKSLAEGDKAAAEQQKAAEKVAAEEARRRQACAQAMERLAHLDARTARRLGTRDDAGNPVRMTEEEFQRQRAAEQQKIDANCG